MKREILFRAKNMQDEWVYGNYIHSKRFAGCFNEHRIHNQETGLESDIDPETVGQLLVKTEYETFFEGDIIKQGGNPMIYVLMYSEKTQGICAFTRHDYKELMSDDDDRKREILYMKSSFRNEYLINLKFFVIGNILDNHEIINEEL